MIASWERVFAANNFTYGELQAATLALANGSIRAHRYDHCRAINEWVKQGRAKMCRDDDTRPSVLAFICPDCSGTGFIAVPHLQSVIDGEWLPSQRTKFARQYTMAVYCECQRGRRIHERALDSGRGVGMRLAFYETRNPNWREQVAARREEMLALADAECMRRLADILPTVTTEQGKGNVAAAVLPRASSKGERPKPPQMSGERWAKSMQAKGSL